MPSKHVHLPVSRYNKIVCIYLRKYRRKSTEQLLHTYTLTSLKTQMHDKERRTKKNLPHRYRLNEKFFRSVNRIEVVVVLYFVSVKNQFWPIFMLIYKESMLHDLMIIKTWECFINKFDFVQKFLINNKWNSTTRTGQIVHSIYFVFFRFFSNRLRFVHLGLVNARTQLLCGPIENKVVTIISTQIQWVLIHVFSQLRSYTCSIRMNVDVRSFASVYAIVRIRQSERVRASIAIVWYQMTSHRFNKYLRIYSLIVQLVECKWTQRTEWELNIAQQLICMTMQK